MQKAEMSNGFQNGLWKCAYDREFGLILAVSGMRAAIARSYSANLSNFETFGFRVQYKSADFGNSEHPYYTSITF